MRSTSSILAGTIAASLLASPLLLLSIIIGFLIRYPDELHGLNILHIVVVILLLAVSAPLGFVFAGLPVFFGAAVMSWLGRHAPESRSPIVWGAAGAALATVVSIPFLTFLIGESEGDPLLWILAFTIPGIICALVCRRLTTWSDSD